MKSLKLLLLVPFFTPLLGYGQAKDSVAPAVVSTTGGYDTIGGTSISYTVGEAVIATLQNPPAPSAANFYLTEGFQQPERTSALSFSLFVNNESCLNSHDGSASVSISGGSPPYSITWSSDPTYNNLSIDSVLPGSYTVTIKDANGLTTNAAFTIIASEAPCQIKIYTGITPNGDGHNDTWIIDNITLYPQNEVTIYNRWGTEVWKGDGYNNSTIVWKGFDMQGQPLPDGTYFYIVSINGATPQKGWVQLTR